jgi:hypothetical protein
MIFGQEENILTLPNNGKKNEATPKSLKEF